MTFKGTASEVDTASVRIARIRLTMKLVTIMVMLVLTVVSARSCGTTSSSSPLNPASVLHNGIGGTCANQQAVAAAGGPAAASTIAVPAQYSGAVAALTGSTGGLTCPGS